MIDFRKINAIELKHKLTVCLHVFGDCSGSVELYDGWDELGAVHFDDMEVLNVALDAMIEADSDVLEAGLRAVEDFLEQDYLNNLNL